MRDAHPIIVSYYQRVAQNVQNELVYEIATSNEIRLSHYCLMVSTHTSKRAKNFSMRYQSQMRYAYPIIVSYYQRIDQNVQN